MKKKSKLCFLYLNLTQSAKNVVCNNNYRKQDFKVLIDYFEMPKIKHYEPESSISYDFLTFVNFRFSNFFLTQIHPEISYLHKLCLKSLSFAIKYMIYLHILALKHSFFTLSLILLSKKPEATSKYFSK